MKAYNATHRALRTCIQVQAINSLIHCRLIILYAKKVALWWPCCLLQNIFQHNVLTTIISPVLSTKYNTSSILKQAQAYIFLLSYFLHSRFLHTILSTCNEVTFSGKYLLSTSTCSYICTFARKHVVTLPKQNRAHFVSFASRPKFFTGKHQQASSANDCNSCNQLYAKQSKMSTDYIVARLHCDTVTSFVRQTYMHAINVRAAGMQPYTFYFYLLKQIFFGSTFYCLESRNFLNYFYFTQIRILVKQALFVLSIQSRPSKVNYF